MITIAEAISKITAATSLIGPETVTVSDALGRVLATDLVSRLTYPPADVSAMDGYAVRHADLGGTRPALRVVGEAAAGHPLERPIGAGEAARIFTGGVVPEGADTIVIQEDTDRDGETVLINEIPPKGDFVRPAGLDFSAGETLFNAGHLVTARDVGLIAAMNIPWVQVRRRPRVALISTGDELVWPGSDPGPGQIINSNSLACEAYVKVLGGEPLNLGVAPDDQEALARIVAGAQGADLLLTTGGASVGDHDLVQSVLKDREFDLTFYRVAMRPGKPLIFGNILGTPVLGLPGNPVSAGVTSALVVRALMAGMLGLDLDPLATEPGVLARDLPKGGKRQDYMRARLKKNTNGTWWADPFEQQDSSMLAVLARSDGLVVRAPHAPAASKGSPCEVLPLGFATTVY